MQAPELPDFMSYKDKFNKTAFIEKIARIAKRSGAKLVYAAKYRWRWTGSREGNGADLRNENVQQNDLETL